MLLQKHLLYLLIENAFKEWWMEHLKHYPIPEDWNVVHVQNAIQGHPDFLTVMGEIYFYSILIKMGFKTTHQEPCIYCATFHAMMGPFLHQVDDFTIATIDRETTGKTVLHIMTQPSEC